MVAKRKKRSAIPRCMTFVEIRRVQKLAALARKKTTTKKAKAKAIKAIGRLVKNKLHVCMNPNVHVSHRKTASLKYNH